MQGLVACGSVAAAGRPPEWEGAVGAVAEGRVFYIAPICGGKFHLCCLSLPGAEEGEVVGRMDELKGHLGKALEDLKT